MKTKILIILLISLINVVFSQYSDSDNNNKTDKEKDYSREPNPYLVFGVPPWTKFKDIQKRYKKITDKMKQRNSNSAKYKQYKIAYEQIEQYYKKNNYQDKNIFDIIKTTIINIFYYECIIFSVLFISWAIYKFNTFVALLVATCVSVDSIIPHWFSKMIYQYIFSFTITIIIYFREYIFYGKKTEENNENKDNNVTGRRIRKRFEKIE